MCALQSNSGKKRLLVIEEILCLQNDSIITNWPPLGNQETMQKFTQVSDFISQNIESKIEENKIRQFFKFQRNETMKRIDTLEEKIINILSQIRMKDLIGIYNEATCKSQLKRTIFNNQLDEDSLKGIIKNVHVNIRHISEKLETIINNYQNYIQQITLDDKQFFFDSIFNGLDDIFNEKTNSSIQLLSIKQKMEHMQPQLKDKINGINKTFFEFINELPSVPLDRQKYFLKVQQNQLQDQFQNTINIQLDPSFLCTEIKLAILENKIFSQNNSLSINRLKIRNISGNQFGFVNRMLTEQDFGQTFGIQINNLSHWIGLGIIDKELLLKNNSTTKTEQKDNIGFIISQNGYSWSMLKESQFKKDISFKFKTNDIITITFLPKQILFQNITTKEHFSMDFLFEKNKFYFPGFKLFDKNDEIEFI